MDKRTLDKYNTDSESIAANHRLTTPERLYLLINSFFKYCGKTADIGCGSGRDTTWLSNNGYSADGYDASVKMLDEAKKHYPQYKDKFQEAALPDLKGIEDTIYDNVFSNAVIMHLSNEEIIPSCINLLRILKPTGRLIISFRSSRSDSSYEDGKLYSPIDPKYLLLLFESLGGRVLYTESNKDIEERYWHILVIEKTDLENKDGIYRIQDIITRDTKTATYKLALIKSLCHISQNESKNVVWKYKSEGVHVPLERIAVCWLRYYWPFIKKNIKQTSNKKLAFADSVNRLSYHKDDLLHLIEDIDSGKSSKEVKKAIKNIRDTIKNQPIRYAGHHNSPVFKYVASEEETLGYIFVPFKIWRDITNFKHWIEDSVVLEWAKKTNKLNKTGDFTKYIRILMEQLRDDRTTSDIRRLLRRKEITCVWTGDIIKNYDIDHVVPYSIWGNNELWNLLPSSTKINNAKRDKLPTLNLLMKSKEYILHYWNIYQIEYPERFIFQTKRSLGVYDRSNSHDTAFNGLVEICERIALTRGVERWCP